MDPLITDGVDAGLLRVLDRHGRERDAEMRRKRAPPPPIGKDEDKEDNGEPDADSPKHEVDDLA
jgi:hypothetical protein